MLQQCVASSSLRRYKKKKLTRTEKKLFQTNDLYWVWNEIMIMSSSIIKMYVIIVYLWKNYFESITQFIWSKIFHYNKTTAQKQRSEREKERENDDIYSSLFVISSQKKNEDSLVYAPTKYFKGLNPTSHVLLRIKKNER